MRMTATPNLTQDTSSFYDPDEVVPQNSPMLAPKLKLQPSPSPPPFLPLKISPPASRHRGHTRPKTLPSQSDAVLVGFLGGHKHPEVAITAGAEPLPSDPEEEIDSPISDSSESSKSEKVPQPTASWFKSGRGDRHSQAAAPMPHRSPGRTMTTTDSTRRPDAGPFDDLKSLAAGALAVSQTAPKADPVDRGSNLPPVVGQDAAKERRAGTSVPPAIMTARRDDPVYMEDGSVLNAAPSPFSPRSSIYSPRDPVHIGPQHKADQRSPPLMPPNVTGPLPPIINNSPRSETSGQHSLPGIHTEFGEGLKARLAEPTVDKSGNLRHPAFSQSPPTPLRFPPQAGHHHTSPPISPVETFRRGPSSPPGHALAPPGIAHYGGFYGQANGPLPRQSQDYSSSSNTATPNTDQSGSTPATSTSLADRVSIDGLTNPTQGNYICDFSGCSAQPFQTQYLLNSHKNVHSSERPHYCPVPGCPRSTGGKGFKRKNEMIRHGLVHESPGYVCPFCPDREHKYPRPDNLQR